MNKLSLPIAAFFALSTSVDASTELYQSKSYVGGSIAALEFGGNDLSLPTANARFGAEFGDYAALEWRLGTGLDGDDVMIAGSQSEFDLDIFYGAYLLGGFPISEKIQPYALIGYTRAEFEISTKGMSAEYDESDISFGLGVNIELARGFALNAEYVRYIKEDGIELSGPSLGAMYYF